MQIEVVIGPTAKASLPALWNIDKQDVELAATASQLRDRPDQAVG